MKRLCYNCIQKASNDFQFLPDTFDKCELCGEMSSLQYVETKFDTKHFSVCNFASGEGGGSGGGSGIAKIIMVGGGGGGGLRGIEGNKSGGGNSGKYYTFTRNTK